MSAVFEREAVAGGKVSSDPALCPRLRAAGATKQAAHAAWPTHHDAVPGEPAASASGRSRPLAHMRPCNSARQPLNDHFYVPRPRAAHLYHRVAT